MTLAATTASNRPSGSPICRMFSRLNVTLPNFPHFFSAFSSIFSGKIRRDKAFAFRRDALDCQQPRPARTFQHLIRRGKSALPHTRKAPRASFCSKRWQTGRRPRRHDPKTCGFPPYFTASARLNSRRATRSASAESALAAHRRRSKFRRRPTRPQRRPCKPPAVRRFPNITSPI